MKINDIRDLALGVLGMSWVEYCDKTLYELSLEIEGYNARWEEKMIHTRLLYTLIYNVNAPKGKEKTAQQLIPLPSEAEMIRFQKQIEQIEAKVKAQMLSNG